MSFDGVNDVEFGLALDSEVHMIVHFWFNPHAKTGPTALKQTAIVRNDESHTTTYEARVPWSLIGLTQPAAGRWIGFNLLVYDDDRHGRCGWVQWAPGIGYEKNASRFTKIQLGDVASE